MLYFHSYLQFCSQIGIPLVPISPQNLARYIAHLSGRLKFRSIQNYLNIVRLLHKEAGVPSPLDSHFIQGTLRGAKRVLGDLQSPKLPVTPVILKGIFSKLDFCHSLDVTFWAACLVAFFSFFRKSNLFVPSATQFDPQRHLTRQAVIFHPNGVILRVGKTKTIQNAERVLEISLPRIPGSPMCPAQALLLSFRMAPCNLVLYWR